MSEDEINRSAGKEAGTLSRSKGGSRGGLGGDPAHPNSVLLGTIDCPVSQEIQSGPIPIRADPIR